MGLLQSSKKGYQLPPRTAMEVYELLPEGTLAEVINNTIYMSPAPSYQHQSILGNLFSDINHHVRENELGNCLVAPVDVYFDASNALQPDIVFISSANMGIVKKGRIKGCPDLIVEVLSTNRKYDEVDKKLVYQRFGVKEYFLVDPETKMTTTYYHDGKKFQLQDGKKGKLKSKLLKKTFSF
jgi:Uma2 family endonuclease